MKADRYKIRVVRGAFVEPSKLDKLGAVVIEKLNDDEWKSIESLEVDIVQIRELQKLMVKHYAGNTAPWYLDGYRLDNKKEVVVAFGADDGEDGKLFQFSLNDKVRIDEVVEYGVQKGIPREQMDFYNIEF